MVDYKPILRIVPTLQAAAILKHNVRLATKKKVKAKDIFDIGVTSIVGAALIKEESDWIEGN